MLRSAKSAPARSWAWLLALAGPGRKGAAVLFGAAVLVWLIEALAWPFGAGRDVGGYVRTYIELFRAEGVFPYVAIGRPPISAVLVGAPLELGRAASAVLFAALYAASILAWSAAARVFGRRAAVATALALLVYPGYGALFHGASSDAPFAAAFALLALVFTRAVVAPSAARFAGVGLALALLTLTRPTGQALVWLCLAPLVLGAAWRARLLWTACALVALGLPLGLWIVHNAVRFDDATIVRGGPTTVPLFRAFVVDRIVRPSNGPATRKLARLVQTDLLPYEPYRSYGITLDEFFSSGSFRMHEDLVYLTDRTQGWDSDYALLSEVGREAVFSHPGTYARGVAKTIFLELWLPLYGDRRAAPGDGSASGPAAETTSAGLPVPSEGEPIPSAREEPFTTTPDHSIRQVWTSPTEKHLEFDDRADARRARELDEKQTRLEAHLRAGPGITILGQLADGASRVYPRAILFLLAGLAAVAVRRPARAGIALALTAAGLLVIGVGALGINHVIHYAVPVVPAFILLAVAGLVGERTASETAPSRIARIEPSPTDSPRPYFSRSS